jgi:hypothetical protein
MPDGFAISRSIDAVASFSLRNVLLNLKSSEGKVSLSKPSNVRGHRADEMNETTRYAASEAPGGPRC